MIARFCFSLLIMMTMINVLYADQITNVFVHDDYVEITTIRHVETNDFYNSWRVTQDTRDRLWGAMIGIIDVDAVEFESEFTFKVFDVIARQEAATWSVGQELQFFIDYTGAPWCEYPQMKLRNNSIYNTTINISVPAVLNISRVIPTPSPYEVYYSPRFPTGIWINKELN